MGTRVVIGGADPPPLFANQAEGREVDGSALTTGLENPAPTWPTDFYFSVSAPIVSRSAVFNDTTDVTQVFATRQAEVHVTAFLSYLTLSQPADSLFSPYWGIQIFQGPPLANGQGSILFRVVRPAQTSATWLLDVAALYEQFSRIVRTKAEAEARAKQAFDRPERHLLSNFNFQLMSVFDESVVVEATHLVEAEYFRMVEEASRSYHRFIDDRVRDLDEIQASLAPLMREAETLADHIEILRNLIRSNPTATHWETTRRFQQLCHDCNNYLTILRGIPTLSLNAQSAGPAPTLYGLLPPDHLGQIFEILPQVASVSRINTPVNLDLSPELWEVPMRERAAGMALRDILINLVSNAAKNTEGENVIDVEARTTERGLAITVSDHGRGMDDATLDRVYGQYNPHTGSTPGSLHGIGSSSLVESIVAYQGRMVVESKVGEGTSVRLFIPWDALVETANIPLAPYAVDRPSRGGLVFRTDAGQIQVGAPDWTNKDAISLYWEKGGDELSREQVSLVMPTVFIDEPGFRHPRAGLFPYSFLGLDSFLTRGQQTFVTTTPEGQSRLARLLELAYHGNRNRPGGRNIEKEYPADALGIPTNLNDEFPSLFSSPASDTLWQVRSLDDSGRVTLGGGKTLRRLDQGWYELRDRGRMMASLVTDVVPYPENPLLHVDVDGAKDLLASVNEGKSFFWPLGAEDGFDPRGDTSGFMFVIPGKDGPEITLIDPPSHTLKYFQEHHLPLEAVTQVLITHGHPDHFGTAVADLAHEGLRPKVLTTATIHEEILEQYDLAIGDGEFAEWEFVALAPQTPFRLGSFDLEFEYNLHPLVTLGFEVYHHASEGPKNLVLSFGGDTYAGLDLLTRLETMRLEGRTPPLSPERAFRILRQYFLIPLTQGLSPETIVALYSRPDSPLVVPENYRAPLLAYLQTQAREVAAESNPHFLIEGGIPPIHTDPEGTARLLGFLNREGLQTTSTQVYHLSEKRAQETGLRKLASGTRGVLNLTGNARTEQATLGRSTNFSEIRSRLKDFVDGSGDSRFGALTASLGNGNGSPVWPTLGAAAREEAFRASVALRRLSGLDEVTLPPGLFWLNGYRALAEYSISYPARIMAEGWEAEVYLQIALLLVRTEGPSLERKTQILPDLFSMASTHYGAAGALANTLHLPEESGLAALALKTRSWAEAGYNLRDRPADLSVLKSLRPFSEIQTPDYISEVNTRWKDQVNFRDWVLMRVAEAYLTAATMIEEWNSSWHALISQLALEAYQLARWVYQDTQNHVSLMARESRELMAYAQSLVLAHDVYQNPDVANLDLDPILPSQVLVDYKGTLDAPQRAHALFDSLDASDAAQGYYLFGTFPWEWHDPQAWEHDAEKLAKISEARRTSGEDWEQLQVRHPKLKGDLAGGKYPLVGEDPQTHFERHVATLQAAGLNPGRSNVVILDDQGEVLKRAVAAGEYPASHRGFAQVVQLTRSGNPGTPSSVEEDWREVERKIKLSQTGVYQKVPSRFDWPDEYDAELIGHLNADRDWWITLLDEAPNADEIRAKEGYALLFGEGASIDDYFEDGAASCTPQDEEEILDMAGEDPVLLAHLITLYGLIDAATHEEIPVADLYAMLEPHFEELGIDSENSARQREQIARFQRVHGLTRANLRMLEMA